MPGSEYHYQVRVDGDPLGSRHGTPTKLRYGRYLAPQDLSVAPAARDDDPAALSVADARVREGPDATLAFEVTLNRPASGTVTVDYATANGTATAGSDYTATNGTLSFNTGETGKTVTVAVLDDAHDEGKETLTLRFSNASGARIADGEATGTIENSDPLPQAWLARFGRTVAGHVTDAIAERLTGPAGGSSHVTLGGQRLSLDGNAPDVPNGTAPEAADGLTAFANRIAAHADGGAWERREPGAARSLTGRELLLGSSFRLALGGDNANSASTSWTAWGRAAQSRFDGDAEGLALDGDVTTFTVGGGCDVVALARRRGAGAQHRRGRLPRPCGEGRPPGPRLGHAGEHAHQRAPLCALPGERASHAVGHARLRHRRSDADGEGPRRRAGHENRYRYRVPHGGGGCARRAGRGRGYGRVRAGGAHRCADRADDLGEGGRARRDDGGHQPPAAGAGGLAPHRAGRRADADADA